MDIQQLKDLWTAMEAYSRDRPWLAYVFMAVVVFVVLTKAYRWLFPKGLKERALFARCFSRYKPLLSPDETKEYRRLAEYVAMASFKVFPKMRFVDVFHPNKCPEVWEAKNLLSGKHIDFVLVDAYGYVHSCIDLNRAYDDIKSYACEAVWIRYVIIKSWEPFRFLDDSCLSSGIMMNSSRAAASFVVGKH